MDAWPWAIATFLRWNFARSSPLNGRNLAGGDVDAALGLDLPDRFGDCRRSGVDQPVRICPAVIDDLLRAVLPGLPGAVGICVAAGGRHQPFRTGAGAGRGERVGLVELLRNPSLYARTK